MMKAASNVSAGLKRVENRRFENTLFLVKQGVTTRFAGGHEEARLPEGRPSGQGSHADGGRIRRAPKVTPDCRTPADFIPKTASTVE